MDKPCRQMTSKPRPRTTTFDEKESSNCEQIELSDATKTYDLPKEMPCKQQANIVELPTAAKKTCDQETISSQVQQPTLLREEKPCKEATEVKPCSELSDSYTERKHKQADVIAPPLISKKTCNQGPISPQIQQPTMPKEGKPCKDSMEVKPCPEPRASSAKRKCNQPKAQEIRSTQTEECADVHKKCEQASKPTVLYTEKLPTSVTVPPYSVVETAGPDKPCGRNELKTLETMQPTTPIEKKPCADNVEQETWQSRRDQEGGRNKDTSCSQDLTILTEVVVPAITSIARRHCKQKPVSKTYERKLPERPCKSSKGTADNIMTKQPNSFAREKPCTKNANVQFDRTAQKQSTEETKSPSRKRPCRKERAIETDSVKRTDNCPGEKITKETRFGQENHIPIFTGMRQCREKKMQTKDRVATQAAGAEDVTKQKPRKPRTQTEVPIPSHQPTVHKRKGCKEQPPPESGAQKEPTEKGAVKPANCADKVERSQPNTEDQHDKAQDPYARCHADETDSVIAWMSQTSIVVGGQNVATESDLVSKSEKQKKDKATKDATRGSGKEQSPSDSTQKRPCKYDVATAAQSLGTDGKPCKPKTEAGISIPSEKTTLPSPNSTQKRPCKYDVATAAQSLDTKDGDKQKPCKQKPEFEIPIPTEKATVHTTKPCKDKASLKSEAQKLPSDQPPSCEDKIDDDHLSTQQQRDEAEEFPCSTNATDSVIAWMSQTSSSLLSGQKEDSCSEQTLTESCLSATESTANKEVSQVAQTTVQQEAQAPSSAPYMSTSNTNTCSCPDVKKSQLPLQTEPDISITSESKPVQKKETKSSRSEDDDKSYPEHSQKPDEQVKTNREPCCKSNMPPRDQSVESTSKLMSRCRQNRILKLFKYKKKLPCTSRMLPDSSESLPSGSSGLSHYTSTTDSESVSDSRYNQQLQGPSAYLQRASEPTKSPVISHNIKEKLAESADTNVHSMKSTETAQYEPSLLTDPGSWMRKAQSDDLDIMIHRQNLSSDDMLHTSEPTLDMLDFPTQTLTTQIVKQTTRKDSGLQPAAISKPVAIPGTVQEDPLTLLEWDSTDNTSAKENVPKKPNPAPQHHVHSVTDGHSGIRGAKIKKDLSKARPGQSKLRKVPDKDEADTDESEDWDSSEKSESESSIRPNIGSFHVADETRKDPGNWSNSNSGVQRQPDEFFDTDWSDDNSIQDYAQPKNTMSSKAAYFDLKD